MLIQNNLGEDLEFKGQVWVAGQSVELSKEEAAQYEAGSFDILDAGPQGTGLRCLQIKEAEKKAPVKKAVKVKADK